MDVIDIVCFFKMKMYIIQLMGTLHEAICYDGSIHYFRVRSHKILPTIYIELSLLIMESVCSSIRGNYYDGWSHYDEKPFFVGDLLV